MAYAQASDLIERFGAVELIQLTDRTNVPPSTLDATAVARALGDAAALADGYLARVCALPLPAVPPVLVRITADIARYYLRGESVEKDGPVALAYRDAVAWLKDVADGRVRLDGGAGAPAEPAPGAAGRVEASRPVFTRDGLRGF